MPRIRLTITSELFDQATQEATIRENLPVRTLLSETLKEFNLPEEGAYSLREESTGTILDPNKTLEQQNVQTGAQLVFTRERRAPAREVNAARSSERQPISGMSQASLREKSSGQAWEIRFQPAIIGRPDPTNPQSAELLAVNLGNFEGAKSVSRYHARITEERGQFFLESLADHNPAYLNGGIVRVGDKRILMPGDSVTVGKITLVFQMRGNTMRSGGGMSSSTMGGTQGPN